MRLSLPNVAPVVLAMLVAGCGGQADLTFCPDVAVPALAISAVDAPTGDPIIDFDVVVRDGPFVDSVSSGLRSTALAAMAREGTYSIEVSGVLGYAVAHVDNVLVEGCIAEPVPVRVELQRRFMILESIEIPGDTTL